MLEWTVLLVGVFLFCQRILDFGVPSLLVGNDTESLQQLDWVLYNAIRYTGTFPLWNPYFRTGWPYFADGFLHVYNPLVSLSVLVFGVWDGPKLAVFLSYLTAAAGMWWLGKVLGMRDGVRIWMGLSYAFTGQAAARFFQGQYDFVYGFAWIPWAIGGLIALAETRRPFYIALAAIFLTLIFFSGNAYYGFYMVFVALLLGLVACVHVRRKPFAVRFELATGRIFFFCGLLALGLSAIQLVPLLEGRAHISKGSDPTLVSAHTFAQVWLDYTALESRRPDTENFPAREEYYAYVGFIPFVLLLFVPFAVWRGLRRWLVFFALLFLGATSYAALKDLPFGMWYARHEFWSQWRFHTRALLFGALALIALCGIGIEAFWRWTSIPWPARGVGWIERIVALGARAVLAIVAALMILSVLDVFMANRRPLDTFKACNPQYEALAWLRAHEPNTVFVSNPQGCHGAAISQGFYYIDGWYGFDLVAIQEGMLNRRPVKARPHYLLRGKGIEPDVPNAQLVQSFEEVTIYRVPDSLPYAFAVENRILLNTRTANPLLAKDVLPLATYVSNPNRIELIAQGRADSTLVVLNSLYPGWKVYIDGKPAPLLNVGGFLAAPMLPGVHKYVFVFDPASFKLGLLMTVLSVLVVIGLLAHDVHARLTVPRVVLPPIRAPLRVTLRPVSNVESVAASKATSVARPSLLPLWELNLPRWRVRIAWKGFGVWARADVLIWVVFASALGVYAVTRLFALDKFPIYFVGDEAIKGVLAADLIQRGWRDGRGNLFPFFFDVFGFNNPLISVYFHSIGQLLFGQSVAAVRGSSAVVTILGATAISLALKTVFQVRYWWAGVLFLGLMPAWFLHSRTAFETSVMATFYALTLMFYLFYRYRSPSYIFPTLICAAITFYSYGNGQLVIALTGILFLISDLRYHLQNWRTLIVALGLVLLLALPYIHFQLEDPREVAFHLRTLDSYLFKPVPLSEKLYTFVSKYAFGLSPQYWFIPNEHEIGRHRMLGYGHILWWTLPFFLIGLWLALSRFRESKYRALILAMLATPIGGAITEIGITRVLAFVMPAAMMTTLGLDWLIHRLRHQSIQRFAPLPVFGVLTFASLWMLRDALTNGPLWFRDYTLYGMQWGAEQIFQVIPHYLKRDPEAHVFIGSDWANGTDMFVRFFMPNEPRVAVREINEWMLDKKPLDEHMIFVLPPNKYREARESDKFKAVRVDRILKYPDGRDGFYFVRLAYADDVDEIFAAERAERAKPVVDELELEGETVTVTHSRFDMGTVANLFDGDTFTLARGMEANPLVLEFRFSKPRPLKGIAFDFTTMDFALKISLYADEGASPVVLERQYHGLPEDPHVEVDLPNAPPQVRVARIEIKHLTAGERTNVHVREIKFK